MYVQMLLSQVHKWGNRLRGTSFWPKSQSRLQNPNQHHFSPLLCLSCPSPIPTPQKGVAKPLLQLRCKILSFHKWSLTQHPMKPRTRMGPFSKKPFPLVTAAPASPHAVEKAPMCCMFCPQHSGETSVSASAWGSSRFPCAFVLLRRWSKGIKSCKQSLSLETGIYLKEEWTNGSPEHCSATLEKGLSRYIQLF